MAQSAVQGGEYQGVSIPPAGKYELDPVHTVVGFVARHMLSKVRGQFTEFTGTIEVGDAPQDSRVEVEVKTESITTHTEKRDEHLLSGDFLEIEKHPVLTFKSTAVRPTGGMSFELDGDLTIKDITRPVTLSGEARVGAGHGGGADVRRVGQDDHRPRGLGHDLEHGGRDRRLPSGQEGRPRDRG
jgi:polyisoprenoid-binding protein YceI